MYDEVIQLLQEGKAKDAWLKLGELLHHHEQDPSPNTGDDGPPPKP